MVNLPDGHVSDYNGEATPPAIPTIDAGRGASPLSALQPDQLRDQQEEIDEAQHQLEQESAEVKRQLEHHRDDGRARNRVREVNR